MVLTDVQAQILLVNQVGDVDPATGDPVRPTAQGKTGIVMENLPALWEKYSGKAGISTDLRDLYVRRDAIDLVIGVLEIQVDMVQDNYQLVLHLNQRVATRQKQRDVLQTEIERVEKKLQGSFGIRYGDITRKVPIPPPPLTQPADSENYRPDADAPVYTGGSPYFRDRSPVP